MFGLRNLVAADLVTRDRCQEQRPLPCLDFHLHLHLPALTILPIDNYRR